MSLVSGTEFLKPWDVLSDRSIFLYSQQAPSNHTRACAKEVTLGDTPQLQDGAGHKKEPRDERGSKCSVPPLDSGKRKAAEG